MKNARPRADRRRFLLGAGGAALALPVLPSLWPGESAAQAAQGRCFVHLVNGHGGISIANMSPSQATLTESVSYAGHTIRRGALAAPQVNGETRVSAVIRAPSTEFTPALAAKMNFLYGLDIPCYVGHQDGASLGNFAANANGAGFIAQNGQRPTIDQIMAWSPSFYGVAAGIRERIVHFTGNSYGWANPAARSGPIERFGLIAETNIQMFDRLFGTQTTPSSPLLVDQVIEDYRALRASTGRLSAEDRRRLDDHVQQLFELQRRLQIAAGATSMPRPTIDTRQFWTSEFGRRPDQNIQNAQLWNQVFVAGLAAGVNRIVLYGQDGEFSSFTGDYHQDIAHQHAATAGAQATHVASHQLFFRHVVLDLVRRLDAVDRGGGRTLLDDTLVAWNQESGHYTHEAQNMAVMTFGSAGGVLRTGQFIDYRNVARSLPGDGAYDRRFTGLLWQQWLGTVLQTFGIPRAEWEQPSSNLGYPNFNYSEDMFNTARSVLWPASVWNAAGDMLPWLRA